MNQATVIDRNQTLLGDAATMLSTLPTASVDMVLTSPPYFRLRDYQVSGQLGLEPHVDGWIDELDVVIQGIRRVLRPSGTLWLNLGDSFAVHPSQGAPRKSLLLAPERAASRLIDQGWILRNKIVWAKANPMPTSVRDRLACGHEYLYVFAASQRYYFDLDAVRVPHISGARPKRASRAASDRPREAWRGPNGGNASGLAALHRRGIVGHPKGKNPGDVWRIASSNYRSAHHATFPVELARRAIQAGCPPGGLVLDPFMGAGTTAVAAEQLGRDWLGIELSPPFKVLSDQRLDAERTKHSSKQARAAA